jgi:lipoprotein-anchoring transpeptidase ErfK/SrfK
MVLRKLAPVLAVTVVMSFLGPQAPAGAARLEIMDGYYAPGTIVVRTHARRLFLTMRGREAISYPVGVGRFGKQWSGYAHIDGKYVRPAWSPPAEVQRAEPWLPAVIPAGPRNPLGERALTLTPGEYAIHGTNRPDSVGRFVSYGCIRMLNADIIDLYDRVVVGTLVIVEP